MLTFRTGVFGSCVLPRGKHQVSGGKPEDTFLYGVTKRGINMFHGKNEQLDLFPEIILDKL